SRSAPAMKFCVLVCEPFIPSTTVALRLPGLEHFTIRLTLPVSLPSPDLIGGLTGQSSIPHPHLQPRDNGEFAMSQRFAPLSPQDMTADQQRVAQAVATVPRGGLRGPFHALLRSRELADRVRHLGDYVRFESTVPAALRELAILLVARFWSAHYEWNAHRKHAAAAGLDPSVADAIEAG